MAHGPARVVVFSIFLVLLGGSLAAQSGAEASRADDIVLTHISGPARPGMGRSCRIAACAVVPIGAGKRDFERERYGFYSLAGKRLGTAFTRSMARKKDGSTLLGLAYLPPLHLANFPDGIHRGVLRLEEGERPARGEEIPARLRALLVAGGLSFEVIDPAGNRYAAQLPPLDRLTAIFENVEYHGVATLRPAQIVDEAVANEDAGEIWFDLRILRPGDAFQDGAYLSFAWCNGRLEQTSYRDVYARSFEVRVRSPQSWAHLALSNPWWRGQPRAEKAVDGGHAWELYRGGKREALRLEHGAVFAQSLLIHDGAAGAAAAQVRADYEEFFCALDAYRSIESLYPVPAGGSLEAALSEHHGILAQMKRTWRKKGSDPLSAQVEAMVPLVRYEPGTGYGGISLNSRFALAVAMTASPDMALLNRLMAWAAFSFPVLCYHVEGDRLRFDDPQAHLEGGRMPFAMGFLPPARDGVLRSVPAARTWGRVRSAHEKALLERLEGWRIYPLDYGQENVVDVPHHMRSSVYGGQGGLVQACPEYRLYAGAHASAFDHTYGPWSNGVVAEQWKRARKEQAASGEMPGWAHGETRTNANQFLHATWALVIDCDDPALRAASLASVRAWVECLYAIRHPRGLNFCQNGKFTLYPATDGTKVELLPVLAGTYQLGWVDNCARQLLRALRLMGEDDLAAKLNALLIECDTKVLANPAVVDHASGGITYYVKGGFAGLDPPSKWSLDAGVRRYKVKGKEVVFDFSKGRSYEEHFEHHFCAYVELYNSLKERDPKAAASYLKLAKRVRPDLYRGARKIAQDLAEGRGLHWGLPPVVIILQQLRRAAAKKSGGEPVQRR